MANDLATYSEPETHLPSPAEQVRGVMNGLKAIRTFIKEEFKPNIDAGTIPGCGDKPTLFLPGAQKAVMYFNAYPTYRVKTLDLGNGHAEFQVRTLLIGRAQGVQIGEGIGSASTKEKKFKRGAGGDLKKCPTCGAAAVMKSKDKPEYFCWRKKNGCGATFALNHPAMKAEAGPDPNDESAYEVRNTVLKMAKKRSLVDAALTLGCLGELFTQDIEDTYDLTLEPPPQAEAEPDYEPEGQPHGAKGVYSRANPHPRNTGYGAGEFLPPDKNREYEDWAKKYIEKINDAWGNLWGERLKSGMGLPNDVTADLVNWFQFTNHMMNWVRESGWIDPAQVRTDEKARHGPMYLALVYHQSADARAALKAEASAWARKKKEMKLDALYRKYPELATDEWKAEQEEKQRQAEEEAGEAELDAVLDAQGQDATGIGSSPGDDKDGDGWEPGRE
jgi:hypothetical protein